MNRTLHYITVYGRIYAVETYPDVSMSTEGVYTEGVVAECIKFRNVLVFSENEQNALLDIKALLEIRIASLMKSVVQVVAKT